MVQNEAIRPSRGKNVDPSTCRHRRAIDAEISADGKRTGNLICKECGAVFPNDKKNHYFHYPQNT